ncbi:unnamed protein product [Sphagnum jensenii]
MLVSASHEEGVLQPEEEEMLHSVFDFSDTVANEVMTPRTDMICISAEHSVKEFVELVIQHGTLPNPCLRGSRAQAWRRNQNRRISPAGRGIRPPQDPEATSIADSLDTGRGDTILEIGPGIGFLTTYLSLTGARIIAVELDSDAVFQLNERRLPNLEVIHMDFLAFDIETIQCNFTVAGERQRGNPGVKLHDVERPLVIQSFAKLNLTFEILGTLPGGYHEVRTIFHNINLADTLSFELQTAEPGAPFEVQLSVSSTGYENLSASDFVFPLDDTNLIAKAAKKFALLQGCGDGKMLKVAIDKRIPIGAGLAGGSGNAAAALKAMSILFQVDENLTVAAEVASQLGSDINFCLDGGTKIGTNRGEVLTPVSLDQTLNFLIVKPRQIAISTPWIYREYDSHVASLAPNAQIEEAIIRTYACKRLQEIIWQH